jgi:hypothetical protein
LLMNQLKRINSVQETFSAKARRIFGHITLWRHSVLQQRGQFSQGLCAKLRPNVKDSRVIMCGRMTLISGPGESRIYSR